jgi:integrase
LPFFYKSASPSYVSQNVWRVMQRIGKKVGIEDCRPHRLRDTFAVRKHEAVSRSAMYQRCSVIPVSL